MLLVFWDCRPHALQLGVSFNAYSTKTEEEIPPPNADVKVDYIILYFWEKELTLKQDLWRSAIWSSCERVPKRHQWAALSCYIETRVSILQRAVHGVSKRNESLSRSHSKLFPLSLTLSPYLGISRVPILYILKQGKYYCPLQSWC